MKEKDLMNELNSRFGAEAEHTQISKEDVDFLDKRAEIEQLCSWDFNAFVEHFQLIKDYGLEEKLLDSLSWKILNHLEDHEIVELKKTPFYKRFGSQIVIEDALLKR